MKKLKTFRDEYITWETARFAVGGAIGLLILYVTYFIFVDVIGLWYIASSTIAQIASYGGGFYIQKHWTFRNKKEGQTSKQVILYVGSVLGCLGLNALIMYVFVGLLHVRDERAQTIAAAVVTTASFFSTRAILKVKQNKKDRQPR